MKTGGTVKRFVQRTHDTGPRIGTKSTENGVNGTPKRKRIKDKPNAGAGDDPGGVDPIIVTRPGMGCPLRFQNRKGLKMISTNELRDRLAMADEKTDSEILHGFAAGLVMELQEIPAEDPARQREALQRAICAQYRRAWRAACMAFMGAGGGGAE